MLSTPRVCSIQPVPYMQQPCNATGNLSHFQKMVRANINYTKNLQYFFQSFQSH